MIALVTGATGFIGSRLIEQLLADGQNKVYALVRSPAKLSWLRPTSNLNLLAGDLFSLPAIPPDCQVIFHLAGLTKALKPSAYYTVNQQGTASLLEKLRKNGLRPRFVHLSSLAAGRPSTDGTPVREEEPPAPVSPYGHSKLLAEEEVLKYKEQLPVIILRAAAIYGPRDLDFLQFFKTVKRGWLLTFNKKLVMSLCYVDDLVRALEIAATAPIASGEIYNVADPVPRTWDEIGLEAAKILKRRVRKIVTPLWLVKAVAGATEVVARISGRPSALNRSKFLDLEKQFWVAEVSKIKRDLGFETSWDFQRALAVTLSWYQEKKWL
ncbi:MAG: NAD-dependent epimerase/dehydratase family protein [Candidatus Saccharicenans sp.]|uniref:NAD-dependent epimerase/dehydratase family protein n=1 Tax=Candidatus Saccharicenans sp. TaxID=2819258 RepID=UPI00404B6D76